MATVAIGVDVSKYELEVCASTSVDQKNPPRLSVKNGLSGFEALYSWAQSQKGSGELSFCMESTGGYEFDLACFLADKGLKVSVENPGRIRLVASGLGFLNKTDRADARAIAAYTLVKNPRQWILAEETRREISQLSRHRESLLGELNRVRNRLERKSQLPDLEVSQLQALEKLLKEQVSQVDEEQERLSESSADFKKEKGALLKLPGVGQVVAHTVLSEMPDVDLFDTAEEWGAFAGLHPCRRESGMWIGRTMMSRAGNAHVRRVLYMGATAAMKLHPGVKALAERLKDKGKKPKQIRIACMRKLLLLCYGVLKAVRRGETPFYGIDPKKTKTLTA